MDQVPIPVERDFSVQPLMSSEFTMIVQRPTPGQLKAQEKGRFYRFIGQTDRVFRLTDEPREETILFVLPQSFRVGRLQVRFAPVSDQYSSFMWENDGDPPHTLTSPKRFMIGEDETIRYNQENIFRRESGEVLRDDDAVDRVVARVTLNRANFTPSFGAEIHVLILVTY
jgi:hypothetical protein